jgi:hypothetical protein
VDVDDAHPADAGDLELAHDADAPESEQKASGLRLQVALAVVFEGITADDRDAFPVARALGAAGVITQVQGEHLGRVLLRP